MMLKAKLKSYKVGGTHKIKETSKVSLKNFKILIDDSNMENVDNNIRKIEADIKMMKI